MLAHGGDRSKAIAQVMKDNGFEEVDRDKIIIMLKRLIDRKLVERGKADRKDLRTKSTYKLTQDGIDTLAKLNDMFINVI